MRIFLLLIFLPVAALAQIAEPGFPRDTSFTVWSTAQKIRKDFPGAVPVKEFGNLNISGEKDVVYFRLENRPLHADLFYPQPIAGRKIPAVILIHGGGWASGSKSHLVPLAQKLAANGFFAATVEHRLSPEAKYPAAVVDLKTFVKWLKINAAKYSIDTMKIAALGCSSGATLATLLGTTGGVPQFRSHLPGVKVSDKVQAIVNIDGIVDFSDPAESGKDNDPSKPSAGARWFGCTYRQNPEIWMEASPLTWVNEYTPPTLFINSSIDRFHAGRDSFTAVLHRNHIFYEIHTLPDTPHPFWLFYPWFDETWPLVISFLNKIFG